MAGNKILAGIVRQGGGKLLNTAIAKVLPDEPAKTGKRGNLLTGIAGAVAMRVATRSVPGAIVVGSGLIAKKLYDRRRAVKADKAAKVAGPVKDTPAT